MKLLGSLFMGAIWFAISLPITNSVDISMLIAVAGMLVTMYYLLKPEELENECNQSRSV